MEQKELDKLEAVLPDYLRLVRDSPKGPAVHDEQSDDVYPLKNERTAKDAFDYLLSAYCARARRRGRYEMRVALKKLLGIDHDIADLRKEITVEVNRMVDQIRG